MTRSWRWNARDGSVLWHESARRCLVRRGERRTHLERCDECVVSIKVSDDLKASAEADDLPLDVLLEDPVAGGYQHHTPDSNGYT